MQHLLNPQNIHVVQVLQKLDLSQCCDRKTLLVLVHHVLHLLNCHDCLLLVKTLRLEDTAVCTVTYLAELAIDVVYVSGGPGGEGKFLNIEGGLLIHELMSEVSDYVVARFYGVMVSTLDSESNNPSSNLGRTFFYLTLYSNNSRKITLLRVPQLVLVVADSL